MNRASVFARYFVMKKKNKNFFKIIPRNATWSQKPVAFFVILMSDRKGKEMNR